MPDSFVRKTPLATKKTAVYVDGYNLYYGRLRNSPYKWLDLVRLFNDLLTVQDGAARIEAVKLFSAHALARFASHGNASVQAQQAYHRALQIMYPERFSIVLGTHSMDNSGALVPVFRDGMPYDRNDRVRVWKIEEKRTDVNLAMAMYRDAAKGLYDQVVLCSNDSDAEPVLQALREDFPALVIGVVTPVPPPDPAKGAPRGVSASLSRHAHWTRRHLLDGELAAAQLPPLVPTNKKPI
ncbi:MAG: hypothetical protein JWR74_1235, partial [Polaromonas sp.]|nr:hypothetical protein [Polaromonas sp.]